MLKSIKKFLQRVLHQPTGIEAFIASKNPQTAGDVDYWMRVYTRRNGGQYGF
jgi:hypothetical protein